MGGGVSMSKASPYYVGVGGNWIVYFLFIALGRVVAFRKEGGGMSARFYRELAREENHVLMPPGASAPTLREGFISVFVLLPLIFPLRSQEAIVLLSNHHDFFDFYPFLHTCKVLKLFVYPGRKPALSPRFLGGD